MSIVADATTIDKIFDKWSGDVSNVLDVNSSSTTISMPASSTAVTATYKTKTFTITASFGTNGSISPAGPVSVNYGSSQAFSITPAADYHVANVLVDGISVGAVSGYTFTNVTADHSISATFSANISSYIVTFIEGDNGTITGSKVQTVNNGDNCMAVTAHANTHYHFVNWTGALTSTNNPLTVMNVGSDMTITANFAIDTCALNYSAGANGSIIGTNPQTVAYGADGATVTAMPKMGYHFVKWSDDIMTASRRDENVTGNISVIATFAEAETSAVLTMAVNGRGTVSPIPGAYTVDREGITAITATAEHGNSFVNWAVSGNAVVADVNAADTMVTMAGANGTVTANFTSGTLTTLENGIPVFEISGGSEDIRIFKITLPPGQTLLQAQTTAGDFGDCDMYIRHGAVPTLSIYDEKSNNEGNAELIEFNDPASGDWYVMLHAQKAYSGVTLTVRYSTDAPAKVLSLNATQGLFKDRIRLTWAAVSGATNYEIWRSDVNDLALSEKIRTASALSAPPYDDMLAPKNSYKFYYWVRAVNDNYKGSFSDYAYGTVSDGSVVELKNGKGKSGISGKLGSMRTYRINVPAGQAVLEVIVSGGTGDCDVNVSFGENGSKRYSLRSTAIENMQCENPAGGYYYINIYGKTAYSGVTLLAKYTNAVPPKPSALIASNGTFADKIVLTWKASSCATSYDIYRALKIGKTIPTMPAEPIITVAGTEYEDTDVLFGEIYCYWLKSHNPMGFSKATPAVSGYLMQAPTAPGTVAATDGTYFDKVRVTWSKMANATSYEVCRTAGRTFAEVTLVGHVEASNLASYVIYDFTVPVNASPATPYYYWVKGINKVNGQTTLSKSDLGYVSNKGPATATATKGTVFEKVRLSWSPVAGALSYNVWKEDLFLVNVAASPYDDNLAPLDTVLHKYKVQAKYVNGDIGYLSAFSPVAFGYAADAPSTLAAPVLKSVSTNLYTYVLISWSEVAKAQKYRLYRSETNIFSNDNWIADVEGLTYSDEVKPGGIAVGMKYHYWVTAVNGDGLGATISRASASKSGMAAAVVTASFADPKKHPYGQEITVAGAGNGSVKYYSIAVPAETTRLMATLSGLNTRHDDCHVYAKLGCYPTSSSYNAKGADTKTDEVLTVSNPAEGTWYFMLYGSGIDGYTERDLTIACYSAADIYLTTVPVNDLNVPAKVTFKGKVVDKAGTGIPGLTLMARNPITGICSYLGAKTDAAGKFSYSDVISIEGEHTFDFFFDTMPDLAKGTASHTVFTKNTSLYTSVFDFSAYLNASLVDINAADTFGMQAFINSSNGWDDEAISENYQSMWIDKTIGKVQADKALLGKLAGGLYLCLYGVEGAGLGNDTSIEAGTSGSIPISGLSTVPFIVHVDEADKLNVMANLLSLGITDETINAKLAAGKAGVIAIASFGVTGKTNNISLSANEHLNLLLNIANKDATVLFLEGGKYSDVITKKFEVSVGNDRTVQVITSSFVPNTTTITDE